MMQSWSCRGNIYPTCRPTYFVKFTCLNQIEHEKSTERAKDPWNRRIIWILMNHRRRGSSCSRLFHQIWKIKAGSDIMHWGCQLSCGVKRKWCNVAPTTKTRKSKKKTNLVSKNRPVSKKKKFCAVYTQANETHTCSCRGREANLYVSDSYVNVAHVWPWKWVSLNTRQRPSPTLRYQSSVLISAFCVISVILNSQCSPLNGTKDVLIALMLFLTRDSIRMISGHVSQQNTSPASKLSGEM